MSQAPLSFSGAAKSTSHGFNSISSLQSPSVLSVSRYSFPQLAYDQLQFRNRESRSFECTCRRSTRGGDNGGVGRDEEEAKGSGTTARGRRLLKLREEKRKREFDRLHNYPDWAKVLENACKNDMELRAVLGDSIGNPELMRKRAHEWLA